jgi:Putative beta-barrel porin-2, OmpL-like. bbp2
MKYRIIICLLAFAFIGQAQNDSSAIINYTGYAEIYYNYDFGKPLNHERPSFIYNYKRDNEVTLNLAFAKAAYTSKNLRANLALMAGTYAQYNLSAEPSWAQHIFESNIGVKISKQNNIWIDAGIMPSHIGFESAVGADCWTLSRSMLAENSPYYESGIKLSYTSDNQKWYASALLLNGWQRIQRPDGIRRPSFGTQITYKPTTSVILNYSTFIGSDKPDENNALRTYHNFYVLYDAPSKMDFIIGIDIGSDKVLTGQNKIWYSPLIIGRYNINDKNKIAARLEYFNDKSQIIVSTSTLEGFQTSSASVNYDLYITPQVLWRTEMKIFSSKDKIFTSSDGVSKGNIAATMSLSIKL